MRSKRCKFTLGRHYQKWKMLAIAKQGRRKKILLVRNGELQKLLVILAESRESVFTWTLKCLCSLSGLLHKITTTAEAVEHFSFWMIYFWRVTAILWCVLPKTNYLKKSIELHWSTQQFFSAWNNIEALDTILTLNRMQSKITRSNEIFIKPKQSILEYLIYFKMTYLVI